MKLYNLMKNKKDINSKLKLTLLLFLFEFIIYGQCKFKYKIQNDTDKKFYINIYFRNSSQII